MNYVMMCVHQNILKMTIHKLVHHVMRVVKHARLYQIIVQHVQPAIYFLRMIHINVINVLRDVRPVML
jgi:hypothetical protein